MHLLWGAAIVALVYPLIGDRHRLRLKKRWSQQLLTILAIRLDARLDDLSPGNLIVANHISWVDIFVINAARPVAFVAKAEVREWPLIGWLAGNTDTVFLRRGSRGHARIVNAEINARLNAGKDVAIFPEGTTTDGSHLLGFHAALLQPAIESGRPVQPLALAYTCPDGTRSLAPAYAGDTSLLQCFSAILSAPAIVARLVPTPSLPASGHDRRKLSQMAHDAIAVRLGLPPVSNPPGKPADPPAAPLSDGVPRDNPNPAPAD